MDHSEVINTKRIFLSVHAGLYLSHLSITVLGNRLYHNQNFNTFSVNCFLHNSVDLREGGGGVKNISMGNC